MDDQEFSELVNRDARSQATPEEAALLRDPANLARWTEVLRGIQGDLDVQFQQRRADVDDMRARSLRDEIPRAEFHDYEAEIRDWRGDASRFKRSIEARLGEAKQLQREANIAASEAGRKEYVTRLRADMAVMKEALAAAATDLSCIVDVPPSLDQVRAALELAERHDL